MKAALGGLKLLTSLQEVGSSDVICAEDIVPEGSPLVQTQAGAGEDAAEPNTGLQVFSSFREVEELLETNIQLLQVSATFW